MTAQPIHREKSVINMQKNNVDLESNSLDEKICAYYDSELYDNELLNFEVKALSSKNFRDYVEEKCFEFFKISL